jgi:hypothetical protein
VPQSSRCRTPGQADRRQGRGREAGAGEVRRRDYVPEARASDEAHKLYIRAFNELCGSCDRLCGISVALSATEQSEMMTTALPVPIAVPRVQHVIRSCPRPQGGRHHDAHGGRSEGGCVSTAKWRQARERLDKDADAELDDQIGTGPTIQYEADREL